MPRLFVALGSIPVGEDLQRRIAAVCAGLPAVRPTSAESRHVTLAFVGEVPASRLPPIEAACAAAAGQGRAEEYVLDRLGGFPGPKARIVALTGAAPPGLVGLAADLGERLHAAGLDVDRRPLRLHVTIARLRDTGRIPAQAIAPLRVMAEEIRLYESELLPAGARYHLISTYALPNGQGPSA